jgi:hypothetical protein
LALGIVPIVPSVMLVVAGLLGAGIININGDSGLQNNQPLGSSENKPLVTKPAGFCGQCGAPFGSQKSFCTSCGERLE